MQVKQKKKRRKRHMFHYWNPKLLNLEIQRCGYTFSASSYVKYLLAVYLGIAGFAYLFQLLRSQRVYKPFRICSRSAQGNLIR